MRLACARSLPTPPPMHLTAPLCSPPPTSAPASAMLASTDALAITAVLRRAGGPEALVTLMEGESLLNDASGGWAPPCA